MRRISTLLVAFMAVMIVASAGMAGVAAAEESPVITEDSTIDDGDIVENFNASSDETETLEFETDGEIDTEELEMSVEKQNGTHFEMSDTSADYEEVEEGDEEDPTVHAFEFDHSDLESVPIDADDEADIVINVSHTYDDDGDVVTDSEELTVTLESTNERTVVYLNDEAIEDDDVGPEIEVDEFESGWNPFADDDQPDTYFIDGEYAIDGNETTVYAFFDDADLEDAFDISDEDVGAFLPGMTFYDTDENEIHRVYADEPGDATDEDDGTYMLVHSDHYELNVGDDYSDNASELEAYTGTHAPGDHDDIGFNDLRHAYFDAHDIGMFSLGDGVWGVFSDVFSANGGLIPFLNAGALAGLAVVSRRAA